VPGLTCAGTGFNRRRDLAQRNEAIAVKQPKKPASINPGKRAVEDGDIPHQ
jgi:hypothetical protein